MQTRKQNKWKRRLKKIAAPVAAAGAVAETMIIAGGRDTLAAVPESVQGVANVVRETGSILSTSVKGMNFLLENFFVIGTALGAGYVGYKIYTRSKEKVFVIPENYKKKLFIKIYL